MRRDKNTFALRPYHAHDPYVALRGRFRDWSPLLLTAVVMAAAALVRMLLDETWAGQYRFMPFYPAILVCTIVGGWRQGVLATAISVALTVGFSGLDLDAVHATAVVFFVASNVVMVALLEAGSRARARAEELAAEAQERERRFNVMADSVPLLIWVHDAEGRMLFVNEAWERFTGLTRGEARGGGWHDLLHPEDRDEFQRRFTECLQFKEPFVCKARIRRSDGVWRCVESYGVPRLGAFGELVAFAGTSLDVTDREALAAEREQLLASERAARTEAEVATRAKDEFLATLSHELRTPLSVIVLWSRILVRKYGDTADDLRKGLGLIIDNGMTLSQLIGDLLDMSRIISGRITLDVRPLDAAELVSQAVASHRPAAEARHITLACDIGPKAKIVLGDPTRMQQVLWNLIGNALKFTPEGGHVWVGAHRNGERLEIVVRDDGEGIAPEFLGQIFSRFHQADGSSARRHGGLGLGLAIVKQLVDLQGGEVIAESEGPGKGATFTVSLPLHESALAANDETGSRRRLEPDRLPNQRLEGLRVLAVEDQLDMLESLRRLLEEQGASVTTLSSGTAALELLRERAADFDVLVSDLGMPRMDGYELIRRVRSDLGLGPERLPAIALTAYARDEDRVRALRAGFQAHLAKPYQVGQLVVLLNQLRTTAAPVSPRESGASLAL